MKSYQNRIDIVSFEPETTTSSYLACLFRPDLPVPVRIRFGAGQNLIFGPARSKFKLCETLQSSQTFFLVAIRTSPFQGASASRGFPKCHFQSLVVPIMSLLWPYYGPTYGRPTYDLRATTYVPLIPRRASSGAWRISKGQQGACLAYQQLQGLLILISQARA